MRERGIMRANPRAMNGDHMPDAKDRYTEDRLNFSIVSYANNAEDVVLARAFRDRPGGFFVDVGAGRPVDGSLTKNLVDSLGWRGVNIEPLPELHTELVRGRPNDINLRLAVGREAGTATLHHVLPTATDPLGDGLSTLLPEISARHERAGFTVKPIEVPVRPLREVLAEHAPVGFDLLKVDVEGAEAEVLESADLVRWRPRALVVEATVPNSPEPSHHSWEPLVLRAGYDLALFDGLNRFYARHDEPELRAKLAVPANVFDKWIPAPLATALGEGLPAIVNR